MTQDGFVTAMAVVGFGFFLIGVTGAYLYHQLFIMFALAGMFMFGYFTGWNEYEKKVTGRDG